jgi:hypothetical protein
LALDPSRILAAQGCTPDPWQRQLLLSNADSILLNCSRGAGKSRTTSVLALHTALFRRKSLVLLISRSQRQAAELFRYVKQGYRAISRPLDAVRETQSQLEFENGSRIVCLPGREETIRSFQGVNLLVLDESGRIPDDLYASVCPMLGVSRGRIICLSTPFGQRGWWHAEWHNPNANWQRFQVPWNQCPRLTADFIERERRKFGDAWIAQEYECSFTAMEGLVYPKFHEQTLQGPAPDSTGGRWFGGIDWGFRNPFAAVWGFVKDDVLYLESEIYARETPLPTLAQQLPRHVFWIADPASPGDINALRRADLKVVPGKNDIRAGIAAVTARLQTNRLRVRKEGCPYLLAEARLYRYSSRHELLGKNATSLTASSSENPVDEHNHALDALRYLICHLDAAYLAKFRRSASDRERSTTVTAQTSSMDTNHPTLWTPL